MQQNDAKALLKKYQEGNCTPDEIALLESWYLKHEIRDLPEIPQAVKDQQLDEIWDALPIHTKSRSVPFWGSIAAAAVLLIIASVSFYFYQQKTAADAYTLQAKNHILPGGNKAILTLANGHKIILTDAGNGLIAKQTGIKITKKNNGQLVYEVTDKAQVNANTFNTIETPRNGQFQIILPDSSKVWLNSGSSIKFPTSFAALKTRRVELKGEAYFEVAHNKTKPFIVNAQNQQVEVLGTHFNINSYTDEAEIRTTLLEGSVKLTVAAESILLKPGQQGYVSSTTSKLVASYVDVATVTAWKDGFFLFNRTDLHALMRQIARWYNVEVVYDPDVKEDVFFGKISRKADLAKVLKILELGGVHFQIEGRTIVVKK